jgi:chromosome segregation ATPase
LRARNAEIGILRSQAEELRSESKDSRDLAERREDVKQVARDSVKSLRRKYINMWRGKKELEEDIRREKERLEESLRESNDRMREKDEELYGVQAEAYILKSRLEAAESLQEKMQRQIFELEKEKANLESKLWSRKRTWENFKERMDREHSTESSVAPKNMVAEKR